MLRESAAAEDTLRESLEETGCDVCGGVRSTPMFEKHGFNVVRCTGCGVAYVSPRPARSELATIYADETYYRNANACAYGYADYLADRGLLEPLVARRMEVIESYRPQRGRLLDIGCATGLLLEEARRRSWDVSGIDVSRYAAQHCRANGLTVHHGDLASTRFPASHFDVVVMDDTVEHLPNPRQDLQVVHRFMKPGGLLTINTADEGGLLCSLMRMHWFHYKPTEHLYYFDRANLARLLESVGFRVLATRLSGKIVTFRYLCGRLRAYSPRASRLALASVARLPGAEHPFFLPIGEFVMFAEKV